MPPSAQEVANGRLGNIRGLRNEEATNGNKDTWLDKDDLQWILKRDYPAKIKGEDGKPDRRDTHGNRGAGLLPKAHQALSQMFERRLRDAGPVDTDTAAGIILPAIDAAMREIRAIRCD